ncbi:7240_t:CDS:2 [Diversispora eburnea]|uniref:7240_t:CDS:1 n=1 Tax=Diversispora eburnea TaxID=1213867 RepID=A0A9N8ZDQ0_9GLOM|nr:7240_t:CDS:2 [Diversispora eburnea]
MIASSQKKLKHGQFKKLGVAFGYILNFYKYPPLEDITVEEFETFALDRLQVLKAIEGAILRNKTEEQIHSHIKQISDEFLPLRSNDGKQRYDLQAERRKDHISHFILRLAYCRKSRFINEKIEDRDAFLRDENIMWPQLSTTEKESMKDELNLTHDFLKDPIFVVEFENALELVSRRAVYLKDGKAYVPAHEQITLVLSEFRKRLEEALLLTSKAFPKLDDERILPLLNNINKQYLGKNFTGKNVIEGKITADDVDEGIGLTIEEALIFWRKSFSMIDDSKFQREYAYNIRHNYGIEGRRKDYAPLGCMSIISNNQPGPSENHGCPFRHFSEENLKATLIDNGIRNTDQINNIITLVRDQHYQIACTRFYEMTRNLEDLNEDKPVVETIQHPNQYYEESIKLAKSKKKTLLPVFDPQQNSYLIRK